MDSLLGDEIDLLLLGASFAGLEFVHQLDRGGYFKKNPKARIVVVDRVDRASYLPLIHEEIYEPDELADPVKVRPFFDRFEQLNFVQAQVKSVDCAKRRVVLEHGQVLCAKRLVIALGSVIQTPKALDPQGLALVLKSSRDRAQLRSRLRSLGPKATVAVIGGGLSGVELAAELAYRQPKTQRVLLIHAQEQLSCGCGHRVDRKSRKGLEALGVELWLNHRVQFIDRDGVQVERRGGGSEHLASDLVCWTGGVSGPSIVQGQDVQVVEGGWLAVDACLRVRASQGGVHPNCYAIGDVAGICPSPGEPALKTMRRAIEAIWQAKTLARQLVRNEPAKAHPVRLQWPHGVSLGPSSLLSYGPWVIDLRGLGRWFRRFLGRMYLRRYDMPPWRRS